MFMYPSTHLTRARGPLVSNELFRSDRYYAVFFLEVPEVSSGNGEISIVFGNTAVHYEITIRLWSI